MAQTPDNPLDWSEPGAPRSRRFGDVYYSLEDGLAESRAVFLAGCGLPDAWAGRARFTVGELGFGTGLNIAALLHLWRESGASGRLHIFSIEGFPVAREDAERARVQLENRKLIERAKGILMRRTGSSEQEAYSILRRTSQDRSVPMVEIAKAVLESEPGYTANPR